MLNWQNNAFKKCIFGKLVRFRKNFVTLQLK